MKLVDKNKIESYLEEFKDFYQKLKKYDGLYRKESGELASADEQKEAEAIREELVRKSGKLKPLATQLTGQQFYSQAGHSSDIWSAALGGGGWPETKSFALGALMDITNRAIGRLESETVFEPSRYQLTSPLYWAEVAWHGIKQPATKIVNWLRSHKIISAIITILIVAITVLGTNWSTVEQNIKAFLKFIAGE